MIYPLCTDNYLIELPLPSQIGDSAVISVKYRKTNQVCGEVNFTFTNSRTTIETSINPNDPELSMALIQFLFLDKSIQKLHINNKSLTKDQYLTEWMMDLPITHVSCCILTNAQGQILMGQRAAKGFYGGVWEMPGGKLDKNEPSDKALVRELKEELGINVDPANVSYISTFNYAYPGKLIILHVFSCNTWQGEISDIVHDDLRWVRYEDIKHMHLPPANLTLLIEFPLSII